MVKFWLCLFAFAIILHSSLACKCPANEEWIKAVYEDATCDAPEKKSCKPIEACRCIEGFVRHKGKCIKACDCPKKCKDPNEEFILAKFEDATCEDPKRKSCRPVKACRCKEGYVRNKGKCIKASDCPTKCKDPNEIWVKKATYEDGTCTDPKRKKCKAVDACRCKDGFVRHEGKCIKESDCPAKCKDPNEVWVKKATYEDATCDDPKRKKCKAVDACRCKDGFVRYEGKCIKESDCPSKCKDPNEVWVKKATYEDATCDDPKRKKCKAVDACRCKDGFVRYEGKCIKESDCPAKCKDPNEVWVKKATYEDATCDDPKRKKCKAVDACRCKDGFVRHEGVCIKETDCPAKCKDPNEVWVKKATYEDGTCDDPRRKKCKPIDACRCKDGYVRYEGVCIKESDCPPKCKDPNEVWVLGATYEDGTCDDPRRKKCKPIDACRCRDGYVRYEGVCIKESDCPPKCKDPNEVWVLEATYEDGTCDDPRRRSCEPVNACRCRDGYVRNEGVCIKESDCPPKCKDPNEVWVLGATYEDGTCDDPRRRSCEPVNACRCRDGYVRYEGVCIKESDCPPKCKDPNEVWVLGATYEDGTCDDPRRRSCEPVNACRCRDGYVRNGGVCIKESDCPPKCKDPNEVWVLGATYEDGTCDDPRRRSCEPVNACRCRDGYVRYEGVCIKESDCPPKCKDPNEVWVLGATYEDGTCDDPRRRSCEPVNACRCRDGYVRYEGVCIKESDCPPKCKDPNEVWVLGATYEDGTCDDPRRRSCEPVNACRCRDGYVRNGGVCIKESDCPPKCKDPNEVWVLGATYEDGTCDDPRRRSCEPVNACRCRDGYVRYEGVCIKESDCPPKCKDPNEVWVLGATYEDGTCDDPRRRSCEPVNACRCRDGYVRNEGVCIKESDCPPKCKDPNEVWVLGATYEDGTCDDPRRRSCEPVNACRCRDGYVRNGGVCIKESDCPPKCKDPNEVWVLGATYEDGTCDDPAKKICEPVDACRCRDGYVRNEGVCIKECDCPPKCKDPNEVFILTDYTEPTCDCHKPKRCKPVQECRCKKGYVRHEGVCIPPCECPSA